VTRYTLRGGYKAEHDAQGEWVLWRDVRDALTTCGELAAQRDRYYAALTRIASIPLTLPNASAGVQAAKDALDGK
jgi:hypothetical protein